MIWVDAERAVWVSHIPERDPSNGPRSTRYGAFLCARGAFFHGASDVLRHDAEHVRTEPLTSGSPRHEPDVDGEHLAAGFLDAVDDFCLCAEGSEQAVEIGGDDDGCFAALDRDNGFRESWSLIER